MFIKIRVLFSRFHPRLYLLGDNVPSVDIFVTVCNEDLDIVRDTVMAALNIDYPRHRFRVIVADDGNTEKLQAWVGSMATEYPTLYYYARSQKGGWKAGNLNHARRFVESLPGGAAECMAGLDADMIPEPRWLRAVTAHLMRDSKMGLVCPAQVRIIPLTVCCRRPSRSARLTIHSRCSTTSLVMTRCSRPTPWTGASRASCWISRALGSTTVLDGSCGARCSTTLVAFPKTP